MAREGAVLGIRCWEVPECATASPCWGASRPWQAVRAVAEVHAARRGRGWSSLSAAASTLRWGVPCPGAAARVRRVPRPYSRRVAPVSRSPLAGRVRTRGDTAVGGQAALREPVCKGTSRRRPRWPSGVARLRWRPMLRVRLWPWGGAVPPRREVGDACLGGCAPWGRGSVPLRWAERRRSGTGRIQGRHRHSMLCLAQPPGVAHGQTVQGACACSHGLVRLAGWMHCSAGVRAGRAGKRRTTAACAARIQMWRPCVGARGCCAAARLAVLVVHAAAGALGARVPACVRAAPGVPALMPSRGSF